MKSLTELKFVKSEVQERLDRVEHRLAMINLNPTETRREKEEIEELEKLLYLYSGYVQKIEKEINLYLKEHFK